MKPFSSDTLLAECVRVSQLIEAGEVDPAEGAEQLATLKSLLTISERAEAADAKAAHTAASRAAILARQTALRAQGEKAYRDAFTRIGRKPPELGLMGHSGVMLVQMMTGQRQPAPTGVPMDPSIAEFFEERRQTALAEIAKIRASYSSRAGGQVNA